MQFNASQALVADLVLSLLFQAHWPTIFFWVSFIGLH